MIVFYPDNSGMGLGQMGTSWVRYMESILKTAKPRNYKISQKPTIPTCVTVLGTDFGTF